MELENSTGTVISLSGFSCDVKAADEKRWPFPAEAKLNSGARMLLYFGSFPQGSLPSANALVFPGGLPDNGAVLTLRDPLDRIIDRVEFGPQILNRSIGRRGQDWALLSAPSPGAPNGAVAALDSGTAVVLNEWLAAGGGTNDFVELYNPAPLPVQLDRWVLTDDPSISGSTNNPLAPLTFIDAGGFALFHADGKGHLGPDHLSYRLDRDGESLRLLNPPAQIVDAIDFAVQRDSVSEGRFPDGASRILRFPGSVSPALPNFLAAGDADGDGMEDAWELLHGFDPTTAADASLDADNDGVSNRDEFLAGTDPHDAASVFRLTIAPNGTSGPTLQFLAQPGRGYRLQCSGDLSDSSWKELLPIAPVDSVRVLVIVDPTPLTQRPTRFYRVIVP